MGNRRNRKRRRTASTRIDRHKHVAGVFCGVAWVPSDRLWDSLHEVFDLLCWKRLLGAVGRDAQALAQPVSNTRRVFTSRGRGWVGNGVGAGSTARRSGERRAVRLVRVAEAGSQHRLWSLEASGCCKYASETWEQSGQCGGGNTVLSASVPGLRPKAGERSPPLKRIASAASTPVCADTCADEHGVWRSVPGVVDSTCVIGSSTNGWVRTHTHTHTHTQRGRTACGGANRGW